MEGERNVGKESFKRIEEESKEGKKCRKESRKEGIAPVSQRS